MNLLGILILLKFIFVRSDDLTVKIEQGILQGHLLNTPSNKPFRAFQGVPYAQPPVGSLRFQSPKPPLSWEGIRDATEDGNVCFAITTDLPTESEDCLYLNVYTPILTNDNKTQLPVMLWIHGGGFTHGHSRYNSTGPDFLIEHDIVIVTLNYRLGPFGFLSTGDDVIPGNAGLKDQAAAIKWTFENIGAFGGDRTKITIAGQSAGSASIGFQLLHKNNEGYFRGAIMQSGSPLNMWSYMLGVDPKAYTIDLARQFNSSIPSNITSASLLNFLVSLDGKDIDIASTKTTIASAPLPVIESPVKDDSFITTSQYELLQTGNFIRVPLLIGTNSEEEIHQGGDLDNLAAMLKKYEDNPTNFIPDNFEVVDGANVTEVGKSIRDLYLEGVPDDERLGHMIRFLSHDRFTRAVIKHADLSVNYTKVFFYVFSYDGPLGNVNITVKGADKIDHAEDTKYEWMHIGDTYSNNDLSRYPPSDGLTLHRLTLLWTNFVKYLNPTPDESSDLLQNLLWPLFTNDEYSYVDIGDDLVVKKKPKTPYYEAWRNFYEKWAKKPFITF
ncbi:juvenile hormone esterase-like [Rhynchophorus ferrugineus]|uniref:juvenile hormone esterase-like n=1 Tax=Rhynchophorus ferrugineus TaxID=354439 RepID=UPI003FCE923F